MAALERPVHDEAEPLPALVRAALVHVQFETIHPFLDGNGRVGRLLIALLLHDAGVLSQPLLYLSLFFKQHRAEYYRRLDAVRREGDWEAWGEGPGDALRARYRARAHRPPPQPDLRLRPLPGAPLGGHRAALKSGVRSPFSLPAV